MVAVLLIKVKKSSMTMVGVVGCALVAGLAVMEVVQQSVRTEPILISTHYLPPYTHITPADIRTVTVPINTGIQGIVSTPQAVVGKYLTYPVPSGYPVTSMDMSTANSYSSFLTEYSLKTNTPGIMVELKMSMDNEQIINPGEVMGLLVSQQNNPIPKQIDVTVLTVLRNGTAPLGLEVFVPNSEYNDIIPALLSGNYQVAIIPQNGAYPSANSISAFPDIQQPSTPDQIVSQASTPIGTVTVTNGQPTTPTSVQQSGQVTTAPSGQTVTTGQSTMTYGKTTTKTLGPTTKTAITITNPPNTTVTTIGKGSK
jgi:hypothetical protein